MAFVKKTIELDADAIKKVKKIFDVSTDKDAVNRALQLVIDEADIIRVHEKFAGSLRLDEPFK